MLKKIWKPLITVSRNCSAFNTSFPAPDILIGISCLRYLTPTQKVKQLQDYDNENNMDIVIQKNNESNVKKRNIVTQIKES